MFNKILCGLDGSVHALRAARTACELAGRFEAPLTFLTVTKELKQSSEIRRFLELEQLAGEPQYVLDEVTEEILANARRLARDKGLTRVLTEVRTGHPARVLVDFAARKNYDCIVLGSRGLGDIEGLLLGSVSHKVATLAKCTVVTVKGG